MTQPTLFDLESLARDAGNILRVGYETDHEIHFKGVIDLVTEIDHQSEAFLLEAIKRRFPDHTIFAEESGAIDGSDHDIWYIDPLDGTVNYAHGVPMFCVSIAYAHNGELTLAAVYDPMRDEMFSAEKGKGAHLNGRAIKCTQVDSLAKSLLVTGFPYDTWYAERNNFDYFVKFSKMTQGVRRLGSAAIDLCYVAAGRLDGFWELILKPWDVAGGGLIAREAGAIVTTVDGDPDFMRSPISILAAGPNLHSLLREQLK
jgi:myo-inositol-1(or 4)-monophosphatase